MRTIQLTFTPLNVDTIWLRRKDSLLKTLLFVFVGIGSLAAAQQTGVPTEILGLVIAAIGLGVPMILLVVKALDKLRDAVGDVERLLGGKATVDERIAAASSKIATKTTEIVGEMRLDVDGRFEKLEAGLAGMRTDVVERFDKLDERIMRLELKAAERRRTD